MGDFDKEDGWGISKRFAWNTIKGSEYSFRHIMDEEVLKELEEAIFEAELPKGKSNQKADMSFDDLMESLNNV